MMILNKVKIRKLHGEIITDNFLKLFHQANHKKTVGNSNYNDGNAPEYHNNEFQNKAVHLMCIMPKNSKRWQSCYISTLKEISAVSNAKQKFIQHEQTKFALLLCEGISLLD